MKKLPNKFLLYLLLLQVFWFFPVVGFSQTQFEFSNDFFSPAGKDRYLSNLVGYNHELDNKQIIGIWSEMRTPDNLRVKVPDEGDSPYSGYTYLTYIQKNHISELEHRRYDYRIGLLGDASKAKRLQKFVHNDLDAGTDPQGWDSQAKSELAVDFIYSHNNIAPMESWVGDTIAVNTYGVRLGNVVVEAFLKQKIEKTFFNRVKGYASLEGHGQAFNTHYEGRMFRSNSDIYTVSLVPFWSAAVVGIETKIYDHAVGFAYTYETKQFKTQEDDHLYGSLYFRGKF